MKESTPFDPKPWRRAWLGVYLANLVVPLHIGWSVTHGAARVGMLLALVPFWRSGHFLCSRSRIVAVVVVAGAGIMACTQINPVLQLSAGAYALGIADQAGFGSSTPPAVEVDSGPGGFLATMVTGSILMGISLTLSSLFGLHAYLTRPSSEAEEAPTRRERFAPKIDG